MHKALGDDKRSSGYIETVSRPWYRFVAPVSRDPIDHDTVPLRVEPRPVELYELVGRGRASALRLVLRVARRALLVSSGNRERRYDEAILWAKRVLEIDRSHLLAGEFLAGVYLKQGDVEQFLAENVRRAKLFGVPEAAMEPRLGLGGAANANDLVRADGDEVLWTSSLVRRIERASYSNSAAGEFLGPLGARHEALNSGDEPPTT